MDKAKVINYADKKIKKYEHRHEREPELITWRNVFNSRKLGDGIKYYECRAAAESVNYQYLAFEGYVYSIDDLKMQNPLCKVKEV